MSGTSSTLLDATELTLALKIDEIVETKWGKHMANIRETRISRFYERIKKEDGEVSYRPTNRYILTAKVFYEREARRIVFMLA